MAIYLGSLVLFRRGLRFPAMSRSSDFPFVSIVVAVKNEAAKLPGVIEQLIGQDYPPDKFEVIIIDNDSTDETLAILHAAADQHSNLHIFTTLTEDTPFHHKKAALAIGIRAAHGEIILTTDADCILGNKWVRTMASYFTDEVGIVVGFSAIRYRDWFTRIQAFDYLQLMAAAQGSINLGFAWACSGQNWAFRKILFEKAGGYMLLRDRIGGDDSLFMQVMQKRTRTKVVFAGEESAWVQTEPVAEAGRFLRQRIRWASEANYMHNLNRVFFAVVLATFLANLVPLVYLVLWLAGLLPVYPLAMAVVLKLNGEGFLAAKTVRIYRKPELMKSFFAWFCLQMPYIVFMGIMSFWGNNLGWGKNR